MRMDDVVLEHFGFTFQFRVAEPRIRSDSPKLTHVPGRRASACTRARGKETAAGFRSTPSDRQRAMVPTACSSVIRGGAGVAARAQQPRCSRVPPLPAHPGASLGASKSVAASLAPARGPSRPCGSRRLSAAVVAALPSRPQVCMSGSEGKLTILVAEKLGKAGIDMLKAYGTVVEAFDMSQADLCAKVSLCDALIVRSATKARDLPVAARSRPPGSPAARTHPARRVRRCRARLLKPPRAASRLLAAPAWASTMWTWPPLPSLACSSSTRPPQTLSPPPSTESRCSARSPATWPRRMRP